jgi:KipI family sensor histidine kinase inhibitor
LSFPRVLPLGDAAVTVELGEGLDAATNARVRALDRDLAAAPFDGFRESVPTHRSLLVLHESGLRYGELVSDLLGRVGRPGPPPPPGRRHEVPTVYGGEQGPDLAPLARALGLAEPELVRLHAAREYTAFMLGFTPGFAYLGLLAPALEAARRATPRVRVAAGSVALAGRQTAVYPVASPGGWQVIGRTALRLFDPHRAQPALIDPGDSVRFLPVPELSEPPPAAAPRPHAGSGSVEVLEPGLRTTVQDAGRAGWRRIGVGGAGAADARALLQANQALGNPRSAAALECLIAGPSLLFHVPVFFALAGADLGARLERADLGPWPVPLGAAVLARPGNVLSFGGRRAGCRAIVALQGGIDVPLVLGSRSTDLGSAFGGLAGRALAAGDRIALLPSASAGRGLESKPLTIGSRPTLRVVLGPQAESLERESVELFLSATWRVGPSSDRVGCRLEGPRLRHRGPAEILSDGMVPGSIQVPPDGRPIVMLADAPTTGGYPKLGTVLSCDLPELAQLVPGEGELRFESVPVEEL